MTDLTVNVPEFTGTVTGGMKLLLDTGNGVMRWVSFSKGKDYFNPSPVTNYTYFWVNIGDIVGGYADAAAVAEFILLDSIDTPITGGTASASSSYPGEGPERMLDGSVSTAWTSNANGMSGNEWIARTLAAPAHPTKLKLIRASIGNRGPGNITLRASNSAGDVGSKTAGVLLLTTAFTYPSAHTDTASLSY